MARAIDTHLAALRKEAGTLEKRISQYLKKQADATIMLSMPGIGEITAATLLAYMPELGTLKRGQAAALAGLAPYVRDSGTLKGKRTIYGGRPQVRKVLYMAASVAVRYNPLYKKHYEALKARGKPFKLAITAVMRKILETLNAMLKYNAPWKS